MALGGVTDGFHCAFWCYFEELTSIGDRIISIAELAVVNELRLVEIRAKPISKGSLFLCHGACAYNPFMVVKWRGAEAPLQ